MLIREPCTCNTEATCTICWGTRYIEQWIPMPDALKGGSQKPINENRNRKKANSS